MDNDDRREIKQVYDKRTKQMLALPADTRPTVGAYKIFKRAAFAVPKRKGGKSGDN